MSSPSRSSYFKAFALGILIAGVALVGFQWFQSSESNAAITEDTEVVLYQNPACGCCSLWGDHMADNGFDVETVSLEVPELDELRQEKGVPPQTRSCHTAVIGDYVVEGHVPAEDVKRLLREQPSIVGIGVPGMPIGSPGMEGSYEEPYDVLAFDAQGQLFIFAEHRP